LLPAVRDRRPQAGLVPAFCARFREPPRGAAAATFLLCSIRTGGAIVLQLLLTAMSVALLWIPATAIAQQMPAPQQPPTEARARETTELNLHAYVELLRSDIRAQKVAIIAQLIEMSEAEDAKFWPLYREYEAELTSVNDKRIGLIETYARAYPDVSDALADDLVEKALDLERQRTALKAKYYARMKSALSSKIAAQFLQVEQQLHAIVDLQIAASLPVVK
jgi:hypothetical protein